ncbi:trehalose-phosphatase [Arthrobacter castelli]|uniref:trehalose-phosphatase n=1 Tax=Arthrobacter castelli TaxID=271431 RepID=UPI00042A26B5|nr:trehalose-phosphatase [Arthrobacter castelli]
MTDDDGALSADLAAALERAAAAEHLLVALDFDGTMAPLVDRAEDARALPRSAAALAGLAKLRATSTALISGRALQTLRSLASPEEQTLLIGSHGAETWTGPGHAPLELDEQARDLLASATAVVAGIVETHPGTSLEEKPAGAVLHTRTAAPETAAAAAEVALRELHALDGLTVTEGKQVVECSVVHSDKGQGIETLRSMTGATAVLFAGDDVTDEDAMAVLGTADVGIKVGPGPSRAGYRVNAPEQMQDVLETLLDLRFAATGPAA